MQGSGRPTGAGITKVGPEDQVALVTYTCGPCLPTTAYGLTKRLHTCGSCLPTTTYGLTKRLRSPRRCAEGTVTALGKGRRHLKFSSTWQEPMDTEGVSWECHRHRTRQGRRADGAGPPECLPGTALLRSHRPEGETGSQGKVELAGRALDWEAIQETGASTRQFGCCMEQAVRPHLCSSKSPGPAGQPLGGTPGALYFIRSERLRSQSHRSVMVQRKCQPVVLPSPY